MGGFGGLHTALREQASFSSLAQSGQADCLHVHEQRQGFQAMLGRRSGHFVQDRFRELLVELVFEARVIGYRRL